MDAPYTFYLQQERLVPSYNKMRQDPTAQARHASIRPPLSALLKGFFDFIGARCSLVKEGRGGMSLLTGREFQAPAGCRLYVEDPASANGQQNFIAGLGDSQLTRIVEEARKAADKMAAKPQRWFHWAEIFDPRELAADKIHRHAPLGEQAMAVRMNLPLPVIPTMEPNPTRGKDGYAGGGKGPYGKGGSGKVGGYARYG